MAERDVVQRGLKDGEPRRAVGMPLWALTTLFLVAAVLPLATAAWVSGSSSQFATEIGAAFAILAATLLFLQFLSSGRFEALSGTIGIDRTMGFHRISAYALVLFALAHPLSYVAPHLPDNPGLAAAQLQAMLVSPRLRSGAVALALLVLLVGLASIRTKAFVRYELWRAAHGPVAILIAALTLHHAFKVGTYSADARLLSVWTIYVLFALGAALVVYVVRPWRMWREDWRIGSATIAGDEITEVILRGPQETSLGNLRGGQFVWLTVAPHRPPFHDHPFSIASSAGFLPRLRLLVRRAGDCTDNFHQLATGTRVAIDGPHGSFVLPSGTSAIVMVAGGVGIAPLLGMLEEAAELGDQRPYRLLYAARNEAALACTDELAELSDRLDLNVTYCADESCSTPGVLRGPICVHHLEELSSDLALVDTAVLICGPPAMMEFTSDAFLALGIPRTNIRYERFDYGAGQGRIDKHRRTAASAILATLAAAAIAFGLR